MNLLPNYSIRQTTLYLIATFAVGILMNQVETNVGGMVGFIFGLIGDLLALTFFVLLIMLPFIIKRELKQKKNEEKNNFK